MTRHGRLPAAPLRQVVQEPTRAIQGSTGEVTRGPTYTGYLSTRGYPPKSYLQLVVSVHTIRSHTKNIYAKLASTADAPPFTAPPS